MIDNIVDRYLNESKDVECPTCKGGGKSPFVKKNDCMTCDGKGKIDKKKYDALMSVRKDLKGKMNERKSKFDYELYHDTYTSAVDTALKHAEVKGYTTDPEEVATYVGFGPRKPGRGKTVTVHIPLYKNGKPQKKALHIVVYNRDVDRNTYELTTYIL
jgi:RecJ-like exonuclease